MSQAQELAQGLQELLKRLERAYQAGRRLQLDPAPDTLSAFLEALSPLQVSLNEMQDLMQGEESHEVWRYLTSTSGERDTAPEPKQPQILIVEDEADTAEMFAEMLGIQGYQVEKIYRADAAIQYLKQHRPDAIVLDIMMPVVSGLEVLHFVRRNPGLEQVPVLIVSAKAIPSEIQEVLNAGANAYLTKPVTFAEFIDTLNALLRER